MKTRARPMRPFRAVDAVAPFTAGGVMFAIPTQKAAAEEILGSVRIDGGASITPRVQVYNFDTEQEFYDWAAKQAKWAYQQYLDTINHTRDLAKKYRATGVLVQGDVVLRIDAVRKTSISATVMSVPNEEIQRQNKVMLKTPIADPSPFKFDYEIRNVPYLVGTKLKLILNENGVLPAWYEVDHEKVHRPGLLRLRQWDGELLFKDDLAKLRKSA